MKLRVYSVSGPSWQPVKNGQRYNKWVGTVQFSDVERVLFGKRYVATITGNSEQEVFNKLDRYIVGKVMNIDPNKIHIPYKPMNKGGANEI